MELTEHNALTKLARKKAGHQQVSVFSLTDPSRSCYIISCYIMVDAGTAFGAEVLDASSATEMRRLINESW